ncbi:NAD-dependent epimerase/dehydratase family protein, partial [Sedimentibacter sp. B4]|uniref:NAD-dependent epimerase/dehydratase family protein n=1 Tax=Sedimentibacter sp. B4 TaxID=304766 RepID=UPI0034D280C2
MTRISVLGGTGYAGAAIVREAAGRGHEVTAFSRKPAEARYPASATSPAPCRPGRARAGLRRRRSGARNGLPARRHGRPG